MAELARDVGEIHAAVAIVKVDLSGLKADLREGFSAINGRVRELETAHYRSAGMMSLTRFVVPMAVAAGSLLVAIIALVAR